MLIFAGIAINLLAFAASDSPVAYINLFTACAIVGYAIGDRLSRVS